MPGLMSNIALSKAKTKTQVPDTHVVCKTQHNFGSAVPPGGDVLSHEPLPLLLVEATRETEVTDLKLFVVNDIRMTKR